MIFQLSNNIMQLESLKSKNESSFFQHLEITVRPTSFFPPLFLPSSLANTGFCASLLLEHKIF